MLFNIQAGVLLTLCASAYSYVIPKEVSESRSLLARASITDHVCDGGNLGRFTVTGKQISDAKKTNGVHYGDSDKLFRECF